MTDKIKPLFFFLTTAFVFLTTVGNAQEIAGVRRYFNKNKINVLTGGNNNGDDKGINVSTIHGLNFSESFAAGLGIGITGGNKYPSTIVPLFINGTLSFADSRRLYLSGDVGYSIATEDGIKGGLLAEISIGRKFRIGKFALAPEVGYRYDKYKAKTLIAEQINGEYVLRVSDNYISDHLSSFSAGISFFF